ncbi:glycosyltransferase [Kitasatospora sp. NPDC058184]|uniref:glycosyltransferase n=1 Tax=Kitasatospora sp. NPDC058184 TaxID=3346370 RepID=UPI0036D8579E
MNGRVVSFTWGRGLGHVSRQIAVHRELRGLGRDSLLLTERPQRLIEDYGFAQTVLPTDADSLVGEPLHGTGPAVDHGLARAMVAWVLRPDDVVLHDVTVQRELYDQAARLGCPQFLVHRFQRNRPDPPHWVSRHTPAIGTIYLLGEPGPEETVHGVRVLGVPHVVRPLLDDRSPWPEETRALRVAVVAGGGGHDDAPGFLTAALHGIRAFTRRRPASAGVDVLVLTGPHFDGAVLVPPGLPGPVRVRPYLGPAYDVYRHADAAITHAGYNTVQELVRSGLPVVAVPGVRDFDDQRVHLKAADSPNVVVADAEEHVIARALAEALNGPSGTRARPAATPARQADGAARIARDLVAATSRGSGAGAP